jgi:hypothetical protein
LFHSYEVPRVVRFRDRGKKWGNEELVCNGQCFSSEIDGGDGPPSNVSVLVLWNCALPNG